MTSWWEVRKSYPVGVNKHQYYFSKIFLKNHELGCFAISKIAKQSVFMPFLPPLPLKCTILCKKLKNNYLPTRYLNNYFLYTHFLYENMWQLWHCGRILNLYFPVSTENRMSKEGLHSDSHIRYRPSPQSFQKLSFTNNSFIRICRIPVRKESIWVLSSTLLITGWLTIPRKGCFLVFFPKR